MDRSEQKVVDDVAVHGFHMITVPDDDVGPGFTYTIGLFKTWRHPEIIIFGTGAEGPRILSTVASLVKHGQAFADGSETSAVLEGLKCTFKTVQPKHYPAHLGVAMRFYRKEGAVSFPAVQCVWPDDDGRFPWDEACSDDVKDRQVALYAAPYVH